MEDTPHIPGLPPLHAAIAVGDAAAVSRLLTDIGSGAATSFDGRGVSALSLAAYLGHAEVVDLLLQAGASAMLPDSSGSLPLHRAAARGKVSGAGWAALHEEYSKLHCCSQAMLQLTVHCPGLSPPIRCLCRRLQCTSCSAQRRLGSGRAGCSRALALPQCSRLPGQQWSGDAAAADSGGAVQPAHTHCRRPWRPAAALRCGGGKHCSRAATCGACPWRSPGSLAPSTRRSRAAAPAGSAWLGSSSWSVQVATRRPAAGSVLRSYPALAGCHATQHCAAGPAAKRRAGAAAVCQPCGAVAAQQAAMAVVPCPCPGLGRALPAVLARSEAEAAQLVARLPPGDGQRLRTSALSLHRRQQQL